LPNKKPVSSVLQSKLNDIESQPQYRYFFSISNFAKFVGGSDEITKMNGTEYLVAQSKISFACSSIKSEVASIIAPNIFFECSVLGNATDPGDMSNFGSRVVFDVLMISPLETILPIGKKFVDKGIELALNERK